MSLAPTPSWRRTVGGGPGLGSLRPAEHPESTKFSPSAVRRAARHQRLTNIRSLPEGPKFSSGATCEPGSAS
jgi:hypothetical protein